MVKLLRRASWSVLLLASGCATAVGAGDDLFSGGPGAGDAAVDAGTDAHDAAADASHDGATTDGASSDAGGDASSDAGGDASADAHDGAVQDASSDTSDAGAGDAATDAHDASTQDVASDAVASDAGGVALVLGAPVDGNGAFGGTGGSTTYDDACPAGEAMTGLHAIVDAYLRRVEIECAPLTLVASGGSASVAVGASHGLGMNGSWPGTDGYARCAAGSVVVGVSGNDGQLVDSLVLACAPLTVSGSAGAWVLGRGATTSTARVGGSGGSAAAPYACPAGMVVHRMSGAYGDGLDQIHFECATVSAP